MISPSFIPDHGNYGFSGVYKFKPGEPNVALFDINAVVIKELENNHKQLFRISFYNEKEGPYISSPRGYGNYAYRVVLSTTTSISAGVSLGFVSRQFSAPSATGTGNVFMPDANAGVAFKHKNTHASVAIYQLFQSEGKVIDAKLRLTNYYQFYGEQVFMLSDQWDLKPQLLLRILPEVTNQWIGGASLAFKKQLELSSMYTQRRGIAFQAMVKVVNDYFPITISVLYHSALLSQTPVWLNSTELGVSYLSD